MQLRLRLPHLPVKLQHSLNRSTDTLDRLIEDCLAGLPQIAGRPIRISLEARLRAHRSKLVAAHVKAGVPVYAATFIRRRKIVIDAELTRDRQLFRLILIHEIFHFVWMRLSNRARNEFAEIVAHEFARRATGEMGESSVVKKDLLSRRDYEYGSRRWREYVCEAFCDTAACLYSEIRHHAVFTLAPRWRNRREAWFRSNVTAITRC